MTAHERLGGRLRPLGATPAWEAAVLAAGLRCTCTGQCSSRHVKGEGRCPHTLDGGFRLYAAPDPTSNPAGAGTASRTGEPLPVWCGPCLDAVRRHAARQTVQRQALDDLDGPEAAPYAAADAVTPALFALPDPTPTRTRTRTTTVRPPHHPQRSHHLSPRGGDAA